MPPSLHLYRLLLKCYPAGFREEYGAAMERQFRDEYRDASGRLERAGLWLRVIGDVLTSAPEQMFHELKLDLKHAGRVYRSRWTSTVLAVLALGLAIGMSTGVFSVLNALLLRSLPFSKPEQLTELWLPAVSAMQGRAAFHAWTGSSHYLQSAAAFSSSDMNLTQGRDAFRVHAAETTSNFFTLLGVKPIVGRTFSAGEDSKGSNAVAVISFGLWQQFFGGSREVVGATLHVNGIPFTVVGVAPVSFDYPSKSAVWLPTVFDFEKVPKKGAFFFTTIGRLKEGLSRGTAAGLFEAEGRHADPAGFASAMSAEIESRPRLIPLRNQLAGPLRQASWVLGALALLVLLTACVNVAQLLFARTSEKAGEMKLRTALGASRARLLQQSITEALCLTFLGAAIGLVVAEWTAQVCYSIAPPQLATQHYTVGDWRVLLFAITVAMVMGIAFGVLPVWLLSQRERLGTTNSGTHRMGASLVALQTALALCLVTGSLAMGHTFLQLLHVDLGFRPQNVLTLNVSIQGQRRSGADEWQYYRQTLASLRQVNGVVAAGAVSYLPLANNAYMANSFQLDSRQKVGRVVINSVTPGYFRAMGIKFIGGSDFAEREASHSKPSVIVNETFAQSTGLGRAVVGRSVTAPWSGASYLIVGVVSSVRFGGPASLASPELYWRMDEEAPASLTLVARLAGKPENYAAQCREAVRLVDPKVPIYDVQTLDQRVSEAFARPRFYTTATIFLGALALLLTAIGSYGTAAFSIAQRTHEIGIRMAIGASYEKIRWMMMGKGLLPIVCGAAAGLVLSFASRGYLEHLLENAARPGMWASVVGAGVLLISGGIALWRAGNRILLIDPVDALRAE